jgi:hypothetical protein
MPTNMLDPFTYIQPGPFISKYQDWILIIILIFFFWSVVGLALKKRFGDSKHFRILVTSTGLFMAISTYYSIYQGWINFTFESLGMFGVFLALVVVFFIIFGLVRSYGMKLNNALPLSYALLYLALWGFSPNIFDNISDIAPPVNLILLVLFFASIWKVVRGFFHHSRSDASGSLHIADKAIKSLKAPSADETEAQTQIEDETKAEKAEQKHIKKDTLKITDLEIKTVDDIEQNVSRMMQLLHERGNNLSAADADSITHVLQKINQDESILKRGLVEIQREAVAYENEHKKEIAEQRQRHAKTKDPKILRFLSELEKFEAQMYQASKFVEQNEKKIIDFAKSFNQQIQAALMQIKDKKARSAMNFLGYAKRNLSGMKHIYEKQHKLERYLLKTGRKTIKDLKREKKARLRAE